MPGNTHYQVLARKWRPQTFQALVGQEYVVRALTNALIQNRLHHAYLFTGTRGVGKTTLARIFAKCLNCEPGITATPCGTCSPCQEIAAGRFIDLLEIDAASRTKVEDTRDLLDNVPYAPTKGRYKIYLIDEVHMLSGHSFNALLKTLEEPPPHVKFLLATTDPQKLPATILSRCLQFHLKNVSAAQLQSHLHDIVQQENISAENEALSLIAHAANGSVRDALSLLDQAIAYGNGQLLTTEIRNLLGTFEISQLLALLQALAQQDAAALFNAINQFAEQGADFAAVLKELLSLLHEMAIYQALGAPTESPSANAAAVAALAPSFTAEEMQLYYQIGTLGRRDLPYAPSARAGFEMIMLRMLAFRPVELQTTTLLTSPTVSSSQSFSAPAATPASIPVSAEPKTPPTVDPAALTNEQWPSLLTQLKLSGAAHSLAAECVLVKAALNEVTLCLKPALASLLSEKQKTYITQAFNDYFARPMRVTFEIGQSDELVSPMQQAAKTKAAKQAAAQQTIIQDENVQTLVSTFNAKITVKPLDTD